MQFALSYLVWLNSVYSWSLKNSDLQTAIWSSQSLVLSAANMWSDNKSYFLDWPGFMSKTNVQGVSICISDRK